MILPRLVFGEDATILRDSNLQLLLLATMFPILGTSLVSPVLESLIEPLGASPTSIGLMISFLTAPAIVAIPIVGVLADRYGRKPVLVVALLLFGAGGSMIMLTTDFRVILGLRVVQGVGFAGIVPVITTSIGDMYDGEREVTGQGFRMLVNGISGAVFPLLAGVLVAVAWQYPFALYAAAFPVAAAVYLRFTEQTTRQAGTDTTTEEPAYRHALSALVSYPRVYVLLIARTLPVIVWIGFLTFNSLIVVRVMGGTPSQAGLVVAVGNLVFGVASSQVGRILSLFGGKFPALVTANIALTVGFVGFLFSPQVGLALLWIVLAGAGFGIALSLYRSYITDLAPHTLRAGLVSLGATGGRLTATVTPIAMGSVIELGTPVLGETAALQLAGVGVAVTGGCGGIICLLVAARAGPVPGERTELSDVSS
jgi:MFS family permease